MDIMSRVQDICEGREVSSPHKDEIVYLSKVVAFPTEVGTDGERYFIRRAYVDRRRRKAHRSGENL